MASSFEQSTTKTPKKQKIRTVIRNAAEQDWTGANVIPDKGELVYASDVNTLKIGDGITSYSNLPAISGGGSGGTTDYTNLINKPQIDGVILVGNKTAADLGFADVATSGDYNDLSNLPTLGTMAAESVNDYTKTSSLSLVATSGSYNDLVNKPSFGTAAYVNAADFATAAQGDLADTAVQPSDLATVATSGNYNDLNNKPTIPAAQVNADWNAKSGVAEILNKPNLATVATSGDYDDLSNKPVIPTVNNPTITITQGGVTKGSFTLNQVTGDTIALDAGGSGSQVQSDWNQTNTTAVDYIKNKPTALSAFTNDEGFITDDGTYLHTDQGSINEGKVLTVGSDGIVTPQDPSGTVDYTQLLNKPQINGNVLTGNKTASQLGFANVATSGSYTDLTDKPTIPAAQQQVDWNASSGITSILNKPTLSAVATSGDYTDLSNKPTINDLTTAEQQDALNSGANQENIWLITDNRQHLEYIDGMIPSTASDSNQLADKAFVNSSIANMAANYVTSNAQGDNFATKAALLAGPYYYKGQSYTLTNNDYALVESDETKNNATTRYIYDGSQWNFQYIVNDTPFTQAQLDAINSTITSNLVTSYSNHVANTDIHVTAAQKTAWTNKQDALVSGTNIKTINSTSLLGSGDISIPVLPSQSGNTGKFLTTDGTDASWATIPVAVPVVQDFWVDSTTGAITCTFSITPTTKTVHTIIGNTAIDGTWNDNVFTPTTASDILSNPNGFVVSVA